MPYCEIYKCSTYHNILSKREDLGGNAEQVIT